MRAFCLFELNSREDLIPFSSSDQDEGVLGGYRGGEAVSEERRRKRERREKREQSKVRLGRKEKKRSDR